MATQTTCPKCDSDDLLVVNLVPRDRPMQFHTCRHCENRWWEDVVQGHDIHLDTVLTQLTS